jgi:hypothetical protein
MEEAANIGITSALIIGIGLFFFILGLHIITWRFFKPKGEIGPIFSVFFLGPLPIVIGLFFWEGLPFNVWDVTFGVILCYALSGAYVLSYPAITTEIPSFKILLLLHRQGALCERELLEAFTQKENVGSRIKLLQQDGLISVYKGKPKLSLAGHTLARIFLCYRMFLGSGTGKG